MRWSKTKVKVNHSARFSLITKMIWPSARLPASGFREKLLGGITSHMCEWCCTAIRKVLLLLFWLLCCGISTWPLMNSIKNRFVELDKFNFDGSRGKCYPQGLLSLASTSNGICEITWQPDWPRLMKGNYWYRHKLRVFTSIPQSRSKFPNELVSCQMPRQGH